ncbi:MAG: bifunctional riboflavin kinase/FAD synthetase [Pseudomonadota bacterium]
MRIVRDYHFVDDADRGAAVAIGNFDGVHLGHQSVLDLTRQVAKDEGAPLGILTFEPHPREYFSPHAPAFRLMNAVAKANRLQKIGVQKLYQLNFNAALSGLSAEEFAQKVLADGLGLRHVLVGEDFCFGKGRSGTASDLRAFGNDMGFGVTITRLVGEDNQVYSSTAIRNALSAGHPKEAAKMLGHYHRIEGEVLHGDARGRDLGYPTANMSLEGLHKPKFGIYAVLVDVLTGAHQGQYHGVASLGERPTFGVNIPNLETFIFDFTGDLYGAELSVALVDFQRPELKFESLEALIKQMDADSMQARQILTTL